MAILMTISKNTSLNSPDPKPLRFGVISDIHAAGVPGTPAWTQMETDLDACMEFWKQEGITAVIQLGDLIDGPPDIAGVQYRTTSALLGRFEGDIRHVIGNHCLDLSLPELLDAAGLPSPYYSFLLQHVRFIVLHAMDITMSSTPAHPDDKARSALLHHEPWAQRYTGALGQRQLHWLQQELDKARAHREEVLICCHLPILRETTDQRHGILWNHEEVRNLLMAYPNISTCLGGHYHPGAACHSEGIGFITFPSFAYRHVQPFIACGIIELENEFVTIRDQHQHIFHRLPREGIT
ncbi:cyclic 3',5'-adenosine monophosphate phosphodiesterase [Prosthecochloris sp. CIB 2401]|uniref:Metallophosphoesterase n=2 Tax=Prosthecochloris TaxID=1101 RepID=A0A5C4RZN7_PROVB|nr:metallophosphoesterase [Prosthecochloris vibrioformis]ANT63968.1 cyclic 3',5'-adenosine monophosphate phosphodiesterase [Prosthecochloris sp. CIB 2401]TNJ36455.1 metallophosphoesterase [Prosthecochloris vibrioformis]